MASDAESIVLSLSVDRRAFSVAARSERGTDLAYWLTRPADERLLAIEVQRQIVYGRSRCRPISARS